MRCQAGNDRSRHGPPQPPLPVSFMSRLSLGDLSRGAYSRHLLPIDICSPPTSAAHRHPQPTDICGPSTCTAHRVVRCARGETVDGRPFTGACASAVRSARARVWVGWGGGVSEKRSRPSGLRRFVLEPNLPPDERTLLRSAQDRAAPHPISGGARAVRSTGLHQPWARGSKICLHGRRFCKSHTSGPCLGCTSLALLVDAMAPSRDGNIGKRSSPPVPRTPAVPAPRLSIHDHRDSDGDSDEDPDGTRMDARMGPQIETPMVTRIGALIETQPRTRTDTRMGTRMGLG